MKGPPLGPGGEDITWPDQVAPRGQKASSTRKIKPQTSNLICASTACTLASRTWASSAQDSITKKHLASHSSRRHSASMMCLASAVPGVAMHGYHHPRFPGWVGPTTEAIGNSVVISGHIQYAQVKLG